MKFDELYKKVINASKAFEERQVPIRLDFKIEDLRDALVESNDTIEKLKKKLEDAKATAYAESVDAGMENRRLKRALWLARAKHAQEMAWNFHEKNLVEKCAKWDNVHLMCRAKAEEYR